MKELCWKLFADRQISLEVQNVLEDAFNNYLENTKVSIDVWQTILFNFIDISYMQCLFAVKDFYIIGFFTRKFILD